MEEEFQEIGHCGGTVTFTISTSQDGGRQFQVTIQHSRNNAAGFFAVYALPQGIAVSSMQIGGLGERSNPPPTPGCFPVFVATDSQGMYGHECKACNGYWRSKSPAGYCPYCATFGEAHQLLTKAQKRYVQQYCDKLSEALEGEDGNYPINMDAVADAVGSTAAKPAFYYSEQRQQNLFSCDACGKTSDILGTYGYCTSCAKRNDLQELKKTFANIRQRINTIGEYESGVKEIVGAFDSYVNRLAKG